MELNDDPGPIDNYVLYDQDNHVSSAVWDGQERGVLRCHEHTSMLDQWKLTPKQIKFVEKAGFGYLRLLPAMNLDNALIAALVERWRRETNTFHLTVGEVTITLEDVALLLGLAIDGEPVIGPISAPSAVCEKLLGRVPEDLNGGMVKLTWLKEFFSECPEDALLEETQRCTRAYLLYLVGSTIFSTTTGNKVPVMYLSLLENFDVAGKFAWGAGALAFLYRSLGNASLKSQSTVSGCLTLVQCWSYSRFNVAQPKFNQDADSNCFPFVLKWKGKGGCRTKCNVASYRKAFDSLNPCDVQWLPYKDMDYAAIPEYIQTSLVLRASRTMLLCFDKEERHLPDRCLRQFGMHQTIPRDVERWERKSRIVDHGADLMGKMDTALKEWSERWLHIVEGGNIVDEDEYMQWYLKITRKYIGRVTSSVESEYQRAVTAMREIANLADIFSTEGLDSYNRGLIDEVKSIAHKCLTEQFEELPKEKVTKKGSKKRKQKDHPSMEYE